MARYRATLIPKLFSYWWETLDRPHRLLDQRLAMRLPPDHFFGPAIFDRFDKFEKQIDNFSRSWSDFLREHENGWSVVKNDEGKFHVSLDVQQFKPDEVNVRVIDNFVVVEGKIILNLLLFIIIYIKIPQILRGNHADFIIRKRLHHSL